MAFSGPSSSGTSGRSVPTTLAEINVTPLVDVMLVLLIVFMISAPLMQQGIEVNLPKANAGSLDESQDQLILTISRGRKVLIADHPIEKGTLSQKLKAIHSTKPQIQVVIQADESVNYGYIAQVMAEVKKSGIHRVGLSTQPGDTRTNL